MSLYIKGTIAALLTSRDPAGKLDRTALAREVEFTLAAGVDGICLGGATGEYVGWTVPQREEMLEFVRELLQGRGRLIVGIGAARLADCVALGAHAVQAGADALLLPAPHFFPYSADDLEVFYQEAARRIDGPILIYNLPQFTSGLGKESVYRLVDSVDNIVGVKDSSGRLDILEFLTQKMPGHALRVVGNDTVMAEALRGGYCDGVISGIAGVLPELTVNQFLSQLTGDDELFDYCRQRTDELIEHLDLFPAPWGLKLIGEGRGLCPVDLPLPLSAQRRRQAEAFQSWFRQWWPRCEQRLGEQAPQPTHPAARSPERPGQPGTSPAPDPAPRH